MTLYSRLLLVVLALATPELGWTQNMTPPPERLLISSGGVDVRTMQMAYKAVDLSPGNGGDPRVVMERTTLLGAPSHVNPFGNFSHNFDIIITKTKVFIEKTIMNTVAERIFA